MHYKRDVPPPPLQQTVNNYYYSTIPTHTIKPPSSQLHDWIDPPPLLVIVVVEASEGGQTVVPGRPRWRTAATPSESSCSRASMSHPALLRAAPSRSASRPMRSARKNGLCS
eukprot:scaffold125798_cov36-Tisochrysis_lutea.AAC.2